MNRKTIIKILALLICSLVTPLAHCTDKLVFALDLIRHGDRTPIKQIPKAPFAWPQGLGELTAEGMDQEHKLGAEKRKTYVEKYHLLPAQFDPETVYVRSSDINRTLMSAESFMLGLYPLGTGPKLTATDIFALPQGFQPIPINTVPTEQDNLMLPAEYGDAKKQRHALYQKYVFPTKAWQDKNAELQSQYPMWSQATGIKINNLTNLIHLCDNLFIRNVHHVALPPGITAKDAKTIIDAGQWSIVQEFKPPMIGNFVGHDLVVVVLNYLKQASMQTDHLKYVLLSGHDTTILGLMSAMHVPLDQMPHYASNVNFELFENNAHDYYVTITYNNKPVVLPACGSAKCTLPQLMTLMKTQ